MRLCSFSAGDIDDVGVATADGVLPLGSVGAGFGPTILDIIAGDQVAALGAAVADPALRRSVLPRDRIAIRPPYRNPPKLWGIGLNFAGHAADLSVTQPDEVPGSYVRPNTTIIGEGDAILLPGQSDRVTAEAELGIVIGTECKNVSRDEAASVIFGFTTILDMTAEDLIRHNPRYVPRAKSFDTFCSIGPWVVTPDEIPDLSEVGISTVVNGRVVASGKVSGMMYDPYRLISFFSEVMTFEAGDIIATGTPGAGVVRDGDTVEAVVEGVGRLRNRVVDPMT